MKIYKEESLRNFEFWSSAKENAKEFTDKQLGQIETILEDMYPDGMDETEINDLFWFEPETLREWLGIDEEKDEEE